MTLSDLAREVGLSPATLSRAETGRGRLSPDRLRRCALAMGVDPDSLQSFADSEDDHGYVNGHAVSGLFTPGQKGAWRRYDDLQLAPALRAALESFLQLGYHGSSVREIAALSGLSVPGLYHHFPAKNDLLVGIMDLTMNDFHARCEAARSEGSTPVERFTLLVECFALFHSHRQELAFIGASEMRSLEEPHRSRIVQLRNDCQHMVDAEVQAMVRDGSARTPLAADAARAVVMMLLGIANWYRAAGPLMPEEIARRYVIHASALVEVVEPVH